MLIELRTYECKPGKRDEWIQLMDEEIIPFQTAKGMVILGSFTVEQDDHTYIWMRRFVDETEREQLYKAVYETDQWRNDISPRVGELLNRETIKVTRLIPTPKSVIQ
ncbi:MAG: NIPSNAP family protein [Caldilineaceae bacterium]|nr:NIPSNAP family protein [Caldilineaceae bacterium]